MSGIYDRAINKVTYTKGDRGGGGGSGEKRCNCWCCYALLLILLALLGLYLLETILSWGYSKMEPAFGYENFAITVYEDRQIELCVRDFACEDGDKIRVSVNSDTVFSGEIYSDPICIEKIKVNQGENSIEIYAINGTGGKGHCPNDINTGEIAIKSKNQQSKVWYQDAKEGIISSLDISVDK